jgi:hypothetical protein
MWTARILIGIMVVGIGFLLWFLGGLFREEPLRPPRIRLQFARQDSATRHLAAAEPVVLGAARRERHDCALGVVVWGNRTSDREGRPSCGMSSSSL